MCNSRGFLLSNFIAKISVTPGNLVRIELNKMVTLIIFPYFLLVEILR
ncbi:MAG: hypothetical protein LBF44_03710 [Holosporaceae bacterium]|jgi:hypothetical protein|nr:hypothetical protein [Holosporaceae bacterium]